MRRRPLAAKAGPAPLLAKAAFSTTKLPPLPAKTVLRSKPKAAPASDRGDKRIQRRVDLAFNNAFAVTISNPLLGESSCIARNISQSGMFVECNEPFPLGSEVRICFTLPANLIETGDVSDWMAGRDGRSMAPSAEIVARGEVKNHYFINYADRGLGPRAVAGMGVRFVGFEAGSDQRLRSSLARVLLH